MACLRERRGRYVIDFYDQLGKRRWKTLPEDITLTDAKKELRHIENQVERGTFISRNKIPLFQKVAEDWIEHKALGIRENTLATYQGHINKHFKRFEAVRINRITLTEVEKLFDGMIRSGAHIDTVKKVRITLNQILRYAVRHSYIDYNPMNDLEPPRDPGSVDPETPKEKKFLVPDEIKNLLDKVEDRKYFSLFMLASFSGAREGELLGLKWDDVDWENSQVKIERTYTKGRFYPPKTKTSKRRVDLGPAVMKALKAWKLACPPSHLDLIFPNGKGNPLNYSNMVNRHFLPALEDAELPEVKFHSLRHSYASIQADQGLPEKYVQSQLGHASSKITREVYTHLLSPQNPEAAERLEERILGEDGSKMVANKMVKKVSK